MEGAAAGINGMLHSLRKGSLSFREAKRSRTVQDSCRTHHVYVYRKKRLLYEKYDCQSEAAVFRMPAFFQFFYERTNRNKYIHFVVKCIPS